MSFSISGVYDLIQSEAGYGIRLANTNGAINFAGNDVVDFNVRTNSSGLYVQLSQIDFTVPNGLTTLQTLGLAPTAGDDQILLTLTHDAATNGVVRASFSLLDNGIVTYSATLTGTGHIFRPYELGARRLRGDRAGQHQFVRRRPLRCARDQSERQLDLSVGQQPGQRPGAGAGRDRRRHLHREGHRRARRVRHPDDQRQRRRHQRCADRGRSGDRQRRRGFGNAGCRPAAARVRRRSRRGSAHRERRLGRRAGRHVAGRLLGRWQHLPDRNRRTGV